MNNCLTLADLLLFAQIAMMDVNVENYPTRIELVSTQEQTFVWDLTDSGKWCIRMPSNNEKG